MHQCCQCINSKQWDWQCSISWQADWLQCDGMTSTVQALTSHRCSTHPLFLHRRQQISSLDLIVGIYNRLQRTILPVERPLVQQKIEAVEAALQRGLNELNWRAEGIESYIAETMELVKDLDLVLTTVKENVKRTRCDAGRSDAWLAACCYHLLHACCMAWVTPTVPALKWM
jgi:hypothetical protein